MALTEQIHVYSLDTGCFYTNTESRLHWRINTLRHEKKALIKKIKELGKKLQILICNENDYKFFLDLKGKNDSLEDTYTDEEYCLIITTIKEINKYKECKIDKNKLIKRYKDKLLIKLKIAVDYNIYMTENKMYDKLKIRKLSDKSLITNNIISVFDSSLTRTLCMKKDELYEDLMVVKVYYFDIIKDMILHGFIHNGDKYMFYTASAGQIRTKKTVFIKESVYHKIEKTLMCGLTIDIINKHGGINVNKFLAYLALSNSATDLWRDFDITKTIVVDDFETNVDGEVDFIDDSTYEVTRKIMSVPITHTDGSGMILPSLSKKNFMCRLPWVKGLLAVFDFKKFISDQNELNPEIKHEIIIDIYGKEHNILEEDIQIIFTKSQFKMYKYFSSWSEYQNNFVKYNCQAGICNLEEDRIKNAKINYQMMQTLTDMLEEELIKIASNSTQKILNLSSTVESMLNAFGVTKYNTNKTYLQQALELYPELLKDVYTKDVLREIKKSLIKDYKSAKLEIDGKYTFLIPDMYAFCEYLFCGIKEPKGLLKDKEVYCNLYKKTKKLDCLRSPHLYREHAVRENVIDDKKSMWFITDAIYTSCHDLISKILQFDVDGDKSLVVADETLVDVAERCMQGIVPLYYNMRKADPVVLTKGEIYNGLNAAYTGGNIGAISNDITKIWNSGKITKEKLKVIKLLCMENNFTIDYAKTLYKPQRPKHIKEMITKYTKEKVPHFFVYAKDKEFDNVNKKNNSLVNKLDDIVKDKKMSFSVKRFGKFNYKILMNNPDIKIDDILLKKYKELNRQYHYKINMDDEYNNNISYIAKEIREELSKFGHSDIEITDMLIFHLYHETNSKSKESLWFCYGNIIVDNIKHNLDGKAGVCGKCGKRFKKKKPYHKYCDECAGYQPLETKIVKCIDCGDEIVVDARNNTKVRCDKCQEIRDKEFKKERNKRYYKRKNHN